MTDAQCFVTVIDAGSTGTRVYVYKWRLKSARAGDNPTCVNPTIDRPGHNGPVTFEEIHDFKTPGAQGGLATKQAGDVPGYLGGPLDNAVRKIRNLADGAAVPDQNNTPLPAGGLVRIYLLGTGGMRDLCSDAATVARCNALLAAARLLIRGQHRYNRTFELQGGDDNNFTSIDGKVEGLYAWVALNYGRRPTDQVVGLHELGGASLQIAYKTDKQAEKVCLFSEPEGHMVYSDSWDGLGAVSARRTHIAALIANIGGAVVVDDPCLPLGQNVITPNPPNGFVTLRGTGMFSECITSATTILRGGSFDRGHRIPPYSHIQSLAHEFIGISNFFHSHEFFADKLRVENRYRIQDGYDVQLFRLAVNAYCGTTNQNYDPNPEYSSARCFNAAFMIALLHNPNYGFAMPPNVDLRKVFTFPIPRTDIASRSSWTMGVAALSVRNRNANDNRRIHLCPPAGGGLRLQDKPEPYEKVLNDSMVIDSPWDSVLPTLPVNDHPSVNKFSVSDIINLGCHVILAAILVALAFRRFQKSRTVKGEIYLAEKASVVMQV